MDAVTFTAGALTAASWWLIVEDSPNPSCPRLQAQAGVQRALQLLLVVIGGCGANELDKVSDGSVVAVLVDAARLPQAPCKQLALQTLSKILSAKPDETCAVFHTLGGTSIAMEVIRKPFLFQLLLSPD